MLKGSAVLTIGFLLENYWTLGPNDAWDVGTERSLRKCLVQSPVQIVREVRPNRVSVSAKAKQLVSSHRRTMVFIC